MYVPTLFELLLPTLCGCHIQGAPSKNDNLFSHGTCRMDEDSPGDEIYLDE